MIKLKDIIKESKWSDRKWGDPLPTLEDVMKEAEVDDEKMIKYKDKDGEQKQMKAGSAKTMPKDHPAKQAWDKLADKGGEEEPKGKGLEPDDFERDFDDSEPEDKEGGEEPSGEPKTFDDIKNHHSKAESAQDKVKDMIDKHNADHQMQDDDYEKWEDKSEALKAIENELQALTADDPNDSSYDGYKKGQKELTKQYISTLNKLSPAAKKILNKEEDKKKYTKQDDEGEPDFYDPEDYEKIYPDKTKPKDEVGDIKYGKGFSPDSDHMFDSVANSAPDASDKYSGMVDSAKSGNWEKFRAGIHDIYDEDAREHLLNLANHVDAGTYKSEFPSGKKGLKFGRKEVMDMFRQAAEYGDEQFGGDEDEDDLEDPAGGKGDAWMHGKSEESITINGKQYKRISESVEPTVFDPFKEAKKQLGSLYTRMKGK